MGNKWYSGQWNLLDSFPNFPQARCTTYPPFIWDFQKTEKERLMARSKRHNRAIRICRRCDHMEDCYLWGVQHEMIGIWGGRLLTPANRQGHRCLDCNRPMIRSRYTKPPRGFRNKYTLTQCVACARQAGLIKSDEDAAA